MQSHFRPTAIALNGLVCLTLVYSKFHSFQYRDRANQAVADDKMKDAHVWWSYVWHEMKKQSVPSFSSSQYNIQSQYEKEGGFSSASLGESNSQANILMNKLRDNLRSSAIELASVRQVGIVEHSSRTFCLYIFYNLVIEAVSVIIILFIFISYMSYSPHYFLFFLIYLILIVFITDSILVISMMFTVPIFLFYFLHSNNFTIILPCEIFS